MSTTPPVGATVRLTLHTSEPVGCGAFQAAWEKGQRVFQVGGHRGKMVYFHGEQAPALTFERFEKGLVSWVHASPEDSPELCSAGDKSHRLAPGPILLNPRSGEKTTACDKQPAPPLPTAHDIVTAAAGHMRDRAATYDKPQGERSMAATVAAFRATTGITLTEEQGWHFMCLLKLVRSQQGQLRMDSYEDGAAYMALAGEAAAKARS